MRLSRQLLLLIFVASGCARESPPPSLPAATLDPAPAPAPAAVVRFEGPGFTLDLPAGQTLGDDRSSYEVGQHTRQLDRNGEAVTVAVLWAIGVSGIDDPAEERSMVEGAASAAGIPLQLRGTFQPTVPGGLASKGYVLSHEDRELVIVHTVCGARTITVATSGRVASLHVLARQVVGTLRCTPDPSRDAASSYPPIALAMPADWQRIESVNHELQWRRGDEVIYFTWTVDANLNAHMAFFESGLALVLAAPPARLTETINGRPAWTADGPDSRVAIGTVFPCGKGRVSAVYSGFSAADGRRWLSEARCP